MTWTSFHNRFLHICASFYYLNSSKIANKSDGVQATVIVWPQEVSKVTKVKMKKIWGKILESPIFDLQKRNIPQKKPQENLHSYLKQNKRLLLWKNWKKVDFAIFAPKKL